jgi:glucokinase
VSGTLIAVDVGGSGVRAAAVRDGWPLGPVARRPLERDLSRAELVQRIVTALLAAADGDAPVGLAAAIPSFVLSDGTVGECPSLPALTGLALAEELGAAAGGVPCELVPDLAAATLGELAHGAGRGVTRFLCTALGTGVNAGATVDGRLVEMTFGCLGDAGHVIVEPDGPRCPCGGRGCLEAVASGYALARDGAALGYPDGRAVIDAARSGREDAAALVRRAGTALGRAVATWSALLWPERVAVAGGLAAAGDLLLEPARVELARVGAPYIVGRIDLVPAELGADATLVGASVVAHRLIPRAA